MKKLLFASFFCLISMVHFGQGGGIEMIANFGGGGNHEGQVRSPKAGDQKYYTIFKRTPLDTTKNFKLIHFSHSVEENILGVSKNFRSKKIDSSRVIFKNELTSNGDFSEINDSLTILPSQFGFVGEDQVDLSIVLKDVDIKFRAKGKAKLEDGATNQENEDVRYNQLVVKVTIDWKIGDRTFTKDGFYINVSNLKKEDLDLNRSFYEAVIGAFDKLISDEEFRAYLENL